MSFGIISLQPPNPDVTFKTFNERGFTKESFYSNLDKVEI